MRDEQFSDMIAGYFAGTASPDEKRAIIKWCSESPENKKAFDELKEIWTITGAVPDNFNPDVQKAWQNVSGKIEDYETASQKSGRNLFFYLPRVAAVLVIGFVLYLLLYNNSGSQITFEKFAASAEKQEFILPDSSKVYLNSNSTLEYVKDFEGKTRYVKLSGEAFFDVTKNPAKPFIVETEYSRAKVLGTSFNYNAYPSQDKVMLVVSSGRVEFSDIENTSSVVLVKNEKAELNVTDYSITKSLNTDVNYNAWKTGILVFENAAFDDIIDEISNYYSQQFEFDNPRIKDARLTVTFDNMKLESVLKILQMSLDVSFRKSNSKIIIN